MHRSLIVRVLPGATPPEDYLKLAVKEFPSAIGMAVATKEGLIVERALGPTTVQAILAVCNEYKDDGKIIALHSFPAGTPEDDIQPFTVIGDDDDDLVVAFADGEFVSFDKPKSTYSDAYHMMDKALGPYLSNIYKQQDSKISEFNAELNKELHDTVINNFSANRGCISTLTADGTIKTFAHGELRKSMPWGWVSQHLGFGEKSSTTAATQAVGDAVGKVKRKLFGNADPTPNTQPDPQRQTPDQPIQVPDKQPGKTQEEIEREDEHAWDRCPATVSGNGRVKEWYRDHTMTGTCPDKWKERPRARLKHTKKEWAAMSPIKDLTKLKEAMESQQPATPPIQDPVPVTNPADKPGTETLPIIPAQETAAYHAWLKKGKPKEMWDKHGDKYDPVAIQAKEKSLPTFEEHTGRPLESTFHWDFAMLKELGANVGIATLALYALRVRDLYMLDLATRPLSDQIGKGTGNKKTEDVVAQETAKHVAAHEVLKPKKKLFG